MPLENEIRDWLADNLDFLEPDLKLIKKEQYLPNDAGAVGFIDIFAKDAQNRVVAIELKRSESAAREAITELAKYAGLLRISRNLRKSELRLIVVSTVWQQLLAPFSEWVNSTDYSVQGYEVFAAPDGSLQSKKLIEPIRLTDGRTICRRHFTLYFKDDDACDDAEAALASMAQSRGMQDFLVFRVIVTVDNIYGVTRALIFAQHRQSRTFYIDQLKIHLPDWEFEEILNYAEDITDPDDVVDELADHLPTFDSIPCETAEICYPEKVFQRLASGSWEKEAIRRFGAFARDERLTDEQLWFELSGLAGTSFDRYAVFACSDDRAKFKEIDRALQTTLFNNRSWRHSIKDCLEYAANLANTTLTLSVFDNSSILDSLYTFALCRDASVLPSFQFLLDGEGTPQMIVGSIRWNGMAAPDLNKLLSEVFHGDFFNGYVMARHFGLQKNVNGRLMTSLGLEFCVDRIELNAPSDVLYDIEVRGTEIVGQKASKGFALFEFFNSQSNFIRDLALAYRRYVTE